MTPKKLSKSLIVFFVANALNVLFPVLSLPILTKHLSPEIYGQFAVAAFSGYYIGVFVECGAGPILLSKVSKYYGTPKGVALIQAAIHVQIKNWAIVSPLFFLIMIFLADVSPIISLIGCISGLQLISCPAWCFYASNRAYAFAVVNIVSRILSLLCMLGVIYLQLDDVYLALAWLVFPIIFSAAVTFLLVFRVFSNGYRFDSRLVKKMSSVFYSLLVGRASATVYGSVLAVLVSVFSPPDIKGLYFLADRIRVALQQVCQPIISFAGSRLSSVHIGGIEGKNLYKKVFFIWFGVCLFVTCVGFFTLKFFNSDILNIVSNRTYFGAADYISVMAYVFSFAVLNSLFVSAVMPSLVLHKKIISVQVFGAAIGCGIVPFIYFSYGLVSAIYGVAIVELFVLILACFFSWRKCSVR